MVVALCGARVFDGDELKSDLAVVIDGKHISAICPPGEIPDSVPRRLLPGGILAPGFIDVQVNGGGGALLNQNPTPEVVRHIAQAHRRFGTTGLLPTVITDADAVRTAAIAAVRGARDAGAASVLGIHIEGPFLDRRRKGAHEARFIRPMLPGDVDEIATADCGIVVLTLAPNMVSPDVITVLTRRGVIVSLGHSDATAAEAQAAVRAGARGFTHLFNAMSPMISRHPGMVGAALAEASTFLGLIADGFHVDDTVMRVALAAAGPERLMLISDAMPPAAGGPDQFDLQGRRVSQVNGQLLLDDGTLAGSALTMDAAVRHLVHQLGVQMEKALTMAALTPARFLGVENKLGRIAPGWLASLVHLDDTLVPQASWVEGT
jgi:N-acetylglucosamine-6-phosphate deacetylase